MVKKRIVIVGGGVVGLSTCRTILSERDDYEVILVEKSNGVGEGTSFSNGGQLSYRYVTPFANKGVIWESLKWIIGRDDSPLEMELRMFDYHQWRWILQFVRACNKEVNKKNEKVLLDIALDSQEILHKWAKEIDEFGWSKSGKLVVFRGENAFKKASLNLVEPETQHVIDGSQGLVDLEPALKSIAPQLYGGIYTSSDETGDCYLFCQALLKDLKKSKNFTLLNNTSIKEFEKKNDGSIKHLISNDGKLIDGDEFVLCAGIDTIELAQSIGLSVPLFPLKGYSLTKENILDSSSIPSISVTDYEQKILYAQTQPSTLRIAAMVDLGSYSTKIPEHRINQLIRQSSTFLPNVGNLETAKRWAGLRPTTPTGVPIISNPFHNLYLNIGQGSLGFTLACGSAKRLLKLLPK